MTITFHPLPNAHTGEKKRRAEVIADLQAERAKRQSRGVNGHQCDAGPSLSKLTWQEKAMLWFAWSCLIGAMAFGVAVAIHATR